MSDDQTPATRASQAPQDAPSASPEDFDGCARECRQAGTHTLVWGRCEHGVEPRPTLSRFETFTADDGYLSGGYKTMSVEQVAEWLTEQGYTVARSGGEVGGEAPRVAQGRTELRDAIADAITFHPGNRSATPEQRHPVSVTLANTIMRDVVGPAIERVHEMTDACDELLVRERAAHARTAERANEAEAAVARVRMAKRHLFSALIANAHRLDEPFTDRPELTPWKLLKQRMRALDAALDPPGPAVEDETAGGKT